jgi:hydrogenase nickel incorporation protein HypA/HybF
MEECGMHELSVAQAIVTIVHEAVPDASVERVDVVVGGLSGVVPSALEFVWEVATSGTRLAGARLCIEQVPTRIRCPACEEIVEPAVGFLCPQCGELSGDVRSGRELEVRSVTCRDAETLPGVPA